MSSLLIVVAGVLMFVSILVASRSTATISNQETDVTDSKHMVLHKILGVSGILISFGGFWVDSMLWAGIILIELGCIAYYVEGNRPSNR